MPVWRGRKLLLRKAGRPGYTTISADLTLEPAAGVPRHTHPGIRSSVVIERSFELPVEGSRREDSKPVMRSKSLRKHCMRAATTGNEMRDTGHLHRRQIQAACDGRLIEFTP